MTTTPLDTWEADQLEKSLSRRVKGGWDTLLWHWGTQEDIERLRRKIDVWAQEAGMG